MPQSTCTVMPNSPVRSLRRYRRQTFTLIGLAAALLLNGCQSAGKHRAEADRAASDIITEMQQEGLGRTDPFSIERPSETFRQRLMLEQELPAVGPASYGVDYLEDPEHWPRVGDPGHRPEAFFPTSENGAEAFEISLLEALQIAATNSRSYQAEKESVFRTALQLDLERYRFDSTFRGALNAMFRSDQGQNQNSASAGGEVGVQRQLEGGATLGSRLTLDLVNLLRGEGTTSLNMLLDTSISVPLMRGSGRHIVTEPRTQAERNVLYALFNFERFRHEYAVRVANEYFSVLQQLDQIANAEAAFRRLTLLVERTEALYEGGRVTGIQVDQARQDFLRARERLISSRENYSRQLDSFKLTLGLPTDARIALSPDEFERLRQQAEEMFGELATDIDLDRNGDETEVVLPQPDPRERGRFEIDEDRAIELALANRLDLRIAEGSVFDAQRSVIVAADSLRPSLNLTGGAAYRGTATRSSTRFAPSDGVYTTGLEMDMPWSRRSERIGFRQSLIQVESAVRSFQDLEDRIKLDVRNGLRNLMQQREGYRIQTEALNVAERRVEEAQALQELGRAEMRDVLDANESLLQAQNSLVDSLVSYRVSELNFQRDLGLLHVDYNGLWSEFDPNGVPTTEDEEEFNE